MPRGTWLLFWILMPTVVALASANPELILVAIVALLAQRWLPDPYLWFKHAAHIRNLHTQIELNPHNGEALRDLVRIYLEKNQPARALPLVNSALERDPANAELRFLQGSALIGTGRAEEALAPLRAAIVKDPKLRYGEAQLKLGNAFSKLGKHREASEAYAALLEINSSSIEGYVRQARALHALGERQQSRQAIDDAKATWRHLPGFLRRKQWTWWARLYWPL